jgi:hypothetical protein
MVNCEISGNTGNAGVYSYGTLYLFKNNLIKGNRTTKNCAGGYFEGAIDNFANNTFVDNISTSSVIANRTSILFKTNNIKFAQNNNFYGTTQNPYGVRYEIEQGKDINLSNNWWNTVDTNSIKILIYDYFDNSSKGVVTFEPFLVAPDPNCPAR